MLRLAGSFALLSAWLVLLLMGWAFGGAVYLLLVAAVALFPWRWLSGRRPAGEGSAGGRSPAGS